MEMEFKDPGDFLKRIMGINNNEEKKQKRIALGKMTESELEIKAKRDLLDVKMKKLKEDYNKLGSEVQTYDNLMWSILKARFSIHRFHLSLKNEKGEIDGHVYQIIEDGQTED